MDAVSFVREKQRMCNSFGDICDPRCPLHDASLGCLATAEKADPEMVVDEVEEWSKEHPFMINGMKVKELIESIGGSFRIAPSGFQSHLLISIDRDWWNAEYREPER